jgi:hypothetical protein
MFQGDDRFQETDMALRGDNIGPLGAVLHAATALVCVDGRPFGTAFFINDEMLLTCAHVARDKSIKIVYAGNPYPAKVVRKAPPDLALLRCALPAGKPPPCVVLDDHPYSGRAFMAGYPLSQGEKPGFEVIQVTEHLNKDLKGDNQRIVIDPGQRIIQGMSGSALVSARSGAVIGVVSNSYGLNSALGGTAILISRAASFPEVKDALINETLPMTRWRDALGYHYWQLLGRSWSIEDRIDVWVKGNPAEWTIRLDPTTGPEIRVHGRHLGDGVAEAVFLWAQRRHVRRDEDVALLGRLLGSALFPAELKDRLLAVSQSDSVLVRLHVGGDGVLPDIPWELAAVPLGSDREVRFLAADTSFRFARVADMNEADAPLIRIEAKPSPDVRVLTAFVQPTSWKYKPERGPSGATYTWPKKDRVCQDLREDIGRGGFQVRHLDQASPGDLHEALCDASRDHRPYDVLHYMGTGQRTRDNHVQIVFAHGNDQEAWEDLRSVLETAADCGVRIVVLELMAPPDNRDLEQLTYHELQTTIGSGIQAAVLTNLPVRPEQCQTFNEKFYASLGRGETIEKAAQLARDDLKSEHRVEDAAGFGWFTVVTGPQADIRLVDSSRQEDPNAPGPGQPASGHRPAYEWRA